MTNTDLSQLQENLGYRFKNQSLLDTALTHRSFLNESSSKQSNERLEYLGDAVLELVISEYLYTTRPSDPEGILTAARAAIVRTESLANAATQIKLGDFLLLSKGEEKMGGRTNTSLLANTFESVLGAIYLDSDINAAQEFINSKLLPLSQEVLQGNLKDPKSLLQESVQELGYGSPKYQTLSEAGPDHDKHFVVAVFAGNLELAQGEGRSKQSAQQAAAASALDNLPPKLI